MKPVFQFAAITFVIVGCLAVKPPEGRPKQSKPEHHDAEPIVLLPGCSPIDPNHFNRTKLTDTTLESIRCDYAAENVGQTLPKIGLALAGGGTRAAYFAHGVMQGLNDSGLLDQVDVISSVSGGGYAAYWYYARRMDAVRRGYDYHAVFADCLPDWWVAYDPGSHGKLLRQAMKNAVANEGAVPCGKSNSAHYKPKDPYVWQAHLARWPDIFQIEPTRLTGASQRAPILPAIDTVLSSSIRHGKGEAGAALRYEMGIDRVWGLEPLPRSQELIGKEGVDNPLAWQFENATLDWRSGGAGFRTDKKFYNWGNWLAWRRDALRKGQSAPNWILNGRIDTKSKKLCSACIYEIGGYQHGSMKTGYQLTSFPATLLSTSLRASAAFADTQGLVKSSVKQFGAKLTDLLTGSVHWGVDVNTPDGKVRRVSDGGGEENTGVLSLVRRGVSNIIMVDAGLDKEGSMEDLCRLKGLLSESGLSLQIDGLQQLDQVCISNGKLGYNTSAWMNPVMTGRIIWPLNSATQEPQMPEIHLWYIKLGWDEQRVRKAFSTGKCGPGAENFDVPCLLAVYWASNSANKDDRYREFPQLSTAGVTYNASSYLFWAYRELGRYAGAKLKSATDDVSKVLSGIKYVSITPQCIQPELRIRRGLRPISRPYEVALPSCNIMTTGNLMAGKGSLRSP